MIRAPDTLYDSSPIFKEVEWTNFVDGTDKQSMRTGMIPYFVDNTTVYLICSRRKDNNKLTDFGGGCQVRRQEAAKVCLLRETKEEGNNFIYNLIKDSLDNESKTQIVYDNQFVGKIQIFQRDIGRQGIYEQYNLLIPVMLNYEDYLIQRQNFLPNEEVSSIELIELYKLQAMPANILSRLFDGSIISFIKLLHSFKSDDLNILIHQQI